MRIIAAYLLAAVLLGGCAIAPGEQVVTKTEAKTVAETDLYSVVTYEDGSYGIRVSNKIYNQAQLADNNNGMPLSIKYESVQEMRDSVLGGKFTETELVWMQKHYPKNAYGEVTLFDPNELYHIVLPGNGRLNAVSFYGEEYNFGFEAGFFSGTLRVSSKERYEEYEKKYHPEKSTTMKLLWTEDDPNTQGKIYYMETSIGVVIKYTVFPVSGEYGKFTVCQKETITGSDPSAWAYYWGEYNGTYVTGHIQTLIERATPEWFQNFGLKPFVETAAE
jgi:hypothetical protein